MDSFAAAKKRGRPDAANGGAAGAKKAKDSTFQGLGSKSKPCTKFFSTSGCPFGEGCHFLHYVPGGFNVVAQMANMGNPTVPPPVRNPIHADGGAPTVKTRVCNKYNTPEGCKFADKCHFAHGEAELGKPISSSQSAAVPGRVGGHFEAPPPALSAAASFGASATAKISVGASLAGAIIGKGGVNSKQIVRVTGAKLSIKDHESDPSLKNIELEGNFDQIKQASAMVRELIVNVSAMAPHGKSLGGPPAGAPGSNFKTKLCDNFNKGNCTFGERCHFAHGAGELRKSAV